MSWNNLAGKSTASTFFIIQRQKICGCLRHFRRDGGQAWDGPMWSGLRLSAATIVYGDFLRFFDVDQF